MAKFVQLASSLESRPFVMYRFIGVTRASANVGSLFLSLCQQVCLLFGKESLMDIIPESTIDRSKFLFRTIAECAQGRKIIILIDSIDQFEDAEGNSDWFPKHLPPNVSFIVSVVTGKEFLLLRQMVHSDQLLLVDNLTLREATAIIDASLRLHKRKLTANQHELLQSACASCQFPLYIQLAVETSTRWKSGDAVVETMAKDMPGIIENYFYNLELKYGETLIAYCLGYITAMKRKHITESDLNKLLSGTDAVLGSLFKFWKPPMRKIPPIIWIRIREELGSYLSEDIVGGELCFAWYHRQFWEAASRRYLTMNLASSGQYDRAAAIYASLANMSAGTLVLPIGGAVELYHDVRTQRNIAEFFDSGIWSWQPGSGPCDDTEAAKWYLRAAEQGDVESMKCIGAMYMQARGVEKDLELGLMWTLKAAQEGNPLAQYNMGCTYGLGVEKDESAAFDWYLRSAKNNVTWAMFQLGIMCEAGLGIEQNFKQAIEWHQRALKVDETNVWSENILGRTYLFGRGVDVDYDMAYEHFLKAAKTDNPQPNAQFYIGCFHFFGIGSFKVNEDLGFDWFLKAASRGFGKALCMVGYCYLTGRGTLQNREVAHDWLKSAVLQLDNPDDEWWMKELAGEFRLWSQNILDSPREADAVIEGEILNGLLASENQKTLRGSVGAFCVVDFVTAEEKTYKWI
ncbi:NACHT domain- and WD repeat-containing protein 1 [Entophlyctis luteolus]|nr:NACHT domain- and WD repeat-containing protein 1 [Entophlyctis luteolus]